jgi:hypothetical protein
MAGAVGQMPLQRFLGTMQGMAETGQCGARLRRIAGCKYAGFLLKTMFQRGRGKKQPFRQTSAFLAE